MGGEFAQGTEWSESKGVDWAALDGERHRGVQELVRLVEPDGRQLACPARAGRRAVGVPVAGRRRRRPLGLRLPAVGGRRQGGRGLPGEHDTCAARGYRVGLPWAGEWRVLLDTNATFFGGTGVGGSRAVWAGDDEPHQGQPASAFVTLPPLAVIWLGSHRP